MRWTLLLIAAGPKPVWVSGLKSTGGSARFWRSFLVALPMAASLNLIALSARGLPIGTAYAHWSGIGDAGTAIARIFYFTEALQPSPRSPEIHDSLSLA